MEVSRINVTNEAEMPLTRIMLVATSAAGKKLERIAAWMDAGGDANLYGSTDDKHSRSELGFNASAVAEACVRLLAHDIKKELADKALLQEISEAYHAGPRDIFMTISLDANTVTRLDDILKAFDKMDVLVKPISKRGVLNRKSPLNIAIEYAYRYILRNQATE